MNSLPTHKVKKAWELNEGHRRKAPLYVVECICGWSSALMQTQADANRVYADHKESAVPSATKGTEP